MPWAVIISLLILGLAKLIEHFFATIIEDKHLFLNIIAGFLVIYVLGVAAVWQLNPYHPPTPSPSANFITFPSWNLQEILTSAESIPLLRFPLALLR